MKGGKKSREGFDRFSILINVILVVVALFVILIGVGYIRKEINTKEDSLGVEAVKFLYKFDDIYELAQNDDKLKQICDDEAYDRISGTKAEKSLNVYLKFKGKKTDVKILRDFSNYRGGYVLYSIDNAYISSDRVFAFIYDVNKDGLLTNVREGEFYDFPDSTDVEKVIKESDFESEDK